MEINKDYLESTFATKEYLESTFATKEYLEETFVKKDEFLELKTEVSEIKEIVIRLDKRDKEDSDAFKSMLLEHGIRINKLEKVVGIK